MSDKPVLIPHDDETWELAEDFGDIPKGFVTDCGSIPRFWWWFIGAPTEPRTCGPYVRHDWKYQTGCVPRKQADEELYGDLINAGIREWQAKSVYYTVRLCGASHYNKPEK